MFKGLLFLGSVTLLPVLGQITPDTVIGKLAVGSAQFVLSVVVVASWFAIYKMFRLWRADIEAERENRKEERKQYETILEANAAASTKLAESNKGLEESVYHISSVIGKCQK